MWQLTPRRLLALALAVVAVVALAGCQQPAPKIRLLAGGDYFDAGARVWCFPGQRFTGPGSCAERTPDSPRLTVAQGQQIGVEVPREVAKRGWYVSIAVAAGDATAGGTGTEKNSGAENNSAEPQFQRGAVQRDNSYFSFTVPNFGGNNAISVQVIALGSGDRNSGLWQFILLNRDAAK